MKLTTSRTSLGVTALLAAFALVAVACTPGPPPASIFTSACANTLIQTASTAITDPRLVELSGIAASRTQPNVLWMHNDSGDSNRIFALNGSGTTLSSFTITGATASDWEDIAIGPGPMPGVQYIYIADIGDNFSSRPEVQVYRFPEPTVPPSNSTVAVIGVETLHLQYAGGPRDAESLIVDPRNGELTIIEKRLTGGTVSVYRAPANLAADSSTTMNKVGTVKLPPGLYGAATGADMASDSNTIAIRTYGDLRVYNVVGASASVQLSIAVPPCIVTGPAETQGEAIAFNPAGNQLITVSEGAGQALHFFTA